MSSSGIDGRQAVMDALDRLEADAEGFTGLPLDALSDPDRVSVLYRLTTIARKFTASGYDVVNRLVEDATPTDIGGPLGLGACRPAAHHPRRGGADDQGGHRCWGAPRPDRPAAATTASHHR